MSSGQINAVSLKSRKEKKMSEGERICGMRTAPFPWEGQWRALLAMVSAVSNWEKWVFSKGDQRNEAGAGTHMELCWYLARCSCFCSHALVISLKLTRLAEVRHWMF